ncbi:MAG TPA: high-potential iron-sulfur protein [Burkholderiales bacterium]|nr:high-potential iron-sulfur protein [Burkholderiales bacterium]
MADDKRKDLPRRTVLKSVALLAGLAAIPLGVKAAGTVPKSAMKYQDNPNGKDECSNCLQFIPGKSASAMGECKVVAGPISPKGWCIAYARKS